MLVISQALYKRTLKNNSVGDESITLAQNVDFFGSRVSFAPSFAKDQIIAFMYFMQLRTYHYGHKV
jgi:hypothetical protein